MFVILFAISILVKLVQFSNAESPIHVTLFGITILVKFLQYSNAEEPMSVTLFGITILFKPLQPLNAKSSILLPPVIITSFSEVGTYRELSL